jgi:hypothetical protein
VVTPNDFANLAEVEARLLFYEELANQQSHLFVWQFTGAKLESWLQRLADQEMLAATSRQPAAV